VSPVSAPVVFEDERLVAVSKPAGQASIPGRGDIGEPLNKELERRLGQRLWVVHRLDREASGLMVFAKTAEAHVLLCKEFESRSAHKVYLAVAAGKLMGEGRADQPLKEFGSGRVAPSKDGKHSLTRWSVERSLKGATLLKVEPLTGRRHQIRAHLAALGHPLLGDPLYGPPPRPVGGAPRLMLHALALSLPAAGVELRAEPGPDFASVLAKLG
jgi:tRNA pseudouridine32 synthase/23S rRNA pseudouridine746 synthase